MKPFNVLLVDDEEEFVKALAERLELRRIPCRMAFNGEAALRMVDDLPPAVMVLDLRMPGIDGMEVLRRVKRTHPDVQVIVLTGHGSEKDEDTARRLGASEYLQKPVDIRVLVNAIQQARESRVAGGWKIL